MTIGERIKVLRRKLDITQEEFAQKLGTTRNTITNYEAGRREPMEATIKSICREFGVNYDWLRTEEGEMFVPTKRDDEITEFIGRIMAGEEDNFKRRFVAMLSRLDESEWEFIERKALELFDESKKD